MSLVPCLMIQNCNDAMMQASHEKRPATKVMSYFPIIPRLKRLFATTKIAKLIRWHAKDRVNDGKLWHPTNGAQWRAINHSYKQSFSNEIRNIRFGLSMDGMNPFNMVSNNHST